MKEIIETARKVTGVDIPAVLVASTKRAKKELGWEPQYSDLEMIVRSAWEWK